MPCSPMTEEITLAAGSRSAVVPPTCPLAQRRARLSAPTQDTAQKASHRTVRPRYGKTGRRNANHTFHWSLCCANGRARPSLSELRLIESELLAVEAARPPASASVGSVPRIVAVSLIIQSAVA